MTNETNSGRFENEDQGQSQFGGQNDSGSNDGGFGGGNQQNDGSDNFNRGN